MSQSGNEQDVLSGCLRLDVCPNPDNSKTGKQLISMAPTLSEGRAPSQKAGVSERLGGLG